MDDTRSPSERALDQMRAAGLMRDRRAARAVGRRHFYDSLYGSTVSPAELLKAYDGSYGDQYWNDWCLSSTPTDLALMFATHLALEIDVTDPTLRWQAIENENAEISAIERHPLILPSGFAVSVEAQLRLSAVRFHQNKVLSIITLPSSGIDQQVDLRQLLNDFDERIEHLIPADLRRWLDNGMPSRKAVAGEEQTKPNTASDEQIEICIRAIYKETKPPPNLAKLWTIAQQRLNLDGLHATKKRVQSTAEADEFAVQRTSPGVQHSRR